MNPATLAGVRGNGQTFKESDMTHSTCSIEQCDRPANARGWCKSHYMRWYTHGVVDDTPVREWDSSRTCSVDGCGARYEASGFCAPHRKRVDKYGDPGAPEIMPRSVGDDAGYTTIHARVKSAYGPARGYNCVACSQPAAEWAFDNRDPEFRTDSQTGCKFSLKIEHYQPMCAKCHRRFDNAVRAAQLGEN